MPLFILSTMFYTIQQILGVIAHNVPAVYDVLPARMRACEAKLGLAKCGGGFAWE
jgi:hypothetical protein